MEQPSRPRSGRPRTHDKPTDGVNRIKKKSRATIISHKSPYMGRKGITHLIDAIVYTARGLYAAVIRETAFKLEVIMATLMIPLALLTHHTNTGKALLITSVLFVLVIELINSAIEATIDRISMDHHQLARIAKDMGSAAVFISILMTAVIWMFIWLD